MDASELSVFAKSFHAVSKMISRRATYLLLAFAIFVGAIAMMTVIFISSAEQRRVIDFVERSGGTVVYSSQIMHNEDWIYREFTEEEPWIVKLGLARYVDLPEMIFLAAPVSQHQLELLASLPSLQFVEIHFRVGPKELRRVEKRLKDVRVSFIDTTVPVEYWQNPELFEDQTVR